MLRSVCQGWLHERMTAWITVASCYCIHLQLCCVQYVRDDYMKEWLLESLWLAIIVFTSSCAAFSMSGMITWKNDCLNHYGQLLLYSPPVLRSVYQGHERMTAWITVASHYCIHLQCCVQYVRDDYMKEWLLESLWLAVIVFTSSAAFNISGTWKNDCLNHCG